MFSNFGDLEDDKNVDPKWEAMGSGALLLALV